MDHSGRSFESDSPFEIAADSCSRMPKWNWRPSRVSGSKAFAPSRPTAFEPVRSAAPGSSQGTLAATAFSTLFEALRVARPFSSASKLGMSASQPSGSSRRCIASRWAAASGSSLA